MTKRGTLPTGERVRELLDYDPEAGVFTWKQTRNNKARAGGRAGHQRRDGYWIITIDECPVGAHRLAWLLVHDRWPHGMIDHANGDPGDNRLANLREANNSQSGGNTRRAKNNTSGFKGVSWNRQKRHWVAMIRKNGRQVALGSFSAPEAAHEAYCAAAREHFGEFARVR
jgi:hypothetical protein